MDAVAAYVRRFPDVKVELQMLDRTVNLVDERIDLAIRTSNDVDPSLIARRLSVCRSVVCAAPAYLNERGTPQRVEELSLHNCLTHAYFGHSLWHFAVAGQQVAVPVSGNISANEVMTLQRAALAGAGITMLPTYQAADAIRRGELVRLLPEAKPRELNLNAVYTSRKHMPSDLAQHAGFPGAAFQGRTGVGSGSILVAYTPIAVTGGEHHGHQIQKSRPCHGPYRCRRAVWLSLLARRTATQPAQRRQ